MSNAELQKIVTDRLEDGEGLVWFGTECEGAEKLVRVPDTPEIAVYKAICYSLLIPLAAVTLAFIALAGWKAAVTLPCWAAAAVLYAKTKRREKMFYAITDKRVITGFSAERISFFSRDELCNISMHTGKNGTGCVTFEIDGLKQGLYALKEPEKPFDILKSGVVQNGKNLKQ